MQLGEQLKMAASLRRVPGALGWVSIEELKDSAHQLSNKTLNCTCGDTSVQVESSKPNLTENIICGDLTQTYLKISFFTDT